jgi:hypothetical protein
MQSKTAVLMLAIASMSCGCATDETQPTPATRPVNVVNIVRSYRILEVRPFTTAEGLAEFKAHVAKMREVLLQDLPAENLFHEVSPEATTAERYGVLVLDARLTRPQSESWIARVMPDVLARGSALKTEVTLTDKTSGTRLAKETILVQSDLGAGVVSGKDRETINHVAREIISFLKGRE